MKINCEDFKKNRLSLREMEDFIENFKKDNLVSSWKPKNWKWMNDYCFRFSVDGKLHKGHVYLVMSRNDFFEIYLTTSHGTIKTSIPNVFMEHLLHVIDCNVHTLASC
jgi:hypothetical protein